jgi:hypothetical protein
MWPRSTCDMPVRACVIMHDLEKLTLLWEEDPEATASEFNRDGRGQDEDDEMRENGAF